MQRMRQKGAGAGRGPPVAKPRTARPGARPGTGGSDISMQDRMNEFLGNTNDNS